jgi:hypothetical protein
VLGGRAVERTFAWLNQFRRLRVRYERRADMHEPFLSLGCAMICWRFLAARTPLIMTSGAGPENIDGNAYSPLPGRGCQKFSIIQRFAATVQPDNAR